MSEQLLKQIISQLDKMDSRLDRIEIDVSKIKTDVSNLEGQMLETNQIVKAVRHNTECISAEVNGLKGYYC